MNCRAVDRLPHLCAVLHLSAADFAYRMGLPLRRAKRILKPSRSPSLKLMARVLRAFPEINAHWLISGTGELFTPQPTTNAGNAIGINYGSSIQVINTSCSCLNTTELMAAHLAEKERTIQLLLTQFRT